MPEHAFARYPGEVMITIPAGSVAVFNSSNWHGGTQNRSGARRRMLHLTYTRRDLKDVLRWRAPKPSFSEGFGIPQLLA